MVPPTDPTDVREGKYPFDRSLSVLKGRYQFLAGVVLLSLSLIHGPAFALLQVNVDTSPLAGTSASVAFDFIDGDASNNNSATISDFSTNGILGSHSISGEVTGTLPGTITLGDAASFNEFL